MYVLCMCDARSKLRASNIQGMYSAMDLHLQFFFFSPLIWLLFALLKYNERSYSLKMQLNEVSKVNLYVYKHLFYSYLY